MEVLETKVLKPCLRNIRKFQQGPKGSPGNNEGSLLVMLHTQKCISGSWWMYLVAGTGRGHTIS